MPILNPFKFSRTIYKIMLELSCQFTFISNQSSITFFLPFLKSTTKHQIIINIVFTLTMHESIHKFSFIFLPQFSILISPSPVFNSIHEPTSIRFPITIILYPLLSMRLPIDPNTRILIFIMFHDPFPINLWIYYGTLIVCPIWKYKKSLFVIYLTIDELSLEIRTIRIDSYSMSIGKTWLPFSLIVCTMTFDIICIVWLYETIVFCFSSIYVILELQLLDKAC